MFQSALKLGGKEETRIKGTFGRKENARRTGRIKGRKGNLRRKGRIKERKPEENR